jgi:vacuolar-type H+-ATPase subunit E/Vma4
MHTAGSVLSVVAAIREEAGVDVERIEKETAAETGRLRSDAQAANVEVADRAQRLDGARRAVVARLAAADWECRRAVIEQREAWIASVIAASTSGAALEDLAREALRNLPAAPCEISVAAHDEHLIDEEWCRRIAAETGKPSVRRAPSVPIQGGCIAQSSDMSFDNSIEERSRRFEHEWRAALCNLYVVQS